jgi:hypothetical protein
MKMKKNSLSGAMCLLLVGFISACGESSEDISSKYDHEPPKYQVANDSTLAEPLQEVSVKVEITDNAGLKRLVFSYSDWTVSQAVDLDDAPKSYTFETTVVVPANAAKTWTKQVIRNDGTTTTVQETYHKLVVTATDINMNVRAIPVYIKIK